MGLTGYRSFLDSAGCFPFSFVFRRASSRSDSMMYATRTTLAATMAVMAAYMVLPRVEKKDEASAHEEGGWTYRPRGNPSTGNMMKWGGSQEKVQRSTASRAHLYIN